MADWRADGDGMAPIPVWKIDAETGEIVWSTDYDCYTVSGNSGGAQGSLAAGKGTLEDIVYIPLGRTPGSLGWSAGCAQQKNRQAGLGIAA